MFDYQKLYTRGAHGIGSGSISCGPKRSQSGPIDWRDSKMRIFFFWGLVESLSRAFLQNSSFCIVGALFLLYSPKFIQYLQIILVFEQIMLFVRKNPALKCGIFACISFVNETWSECNYRTSKKLVIPTVCRPPARGFIRPYQDAVSKSRLSPLSLSLQRITFAS